MRISKIFSNFEKMLCQCRVASWSTKCQKLERKRKAPVIRGVTVDNFVSNVEELSR
jgi:hypothetical protein